MCVRERLCACGVSAWGVHVPCAHEGWCVPMVRARNVRMSVCVYVTVIALMALV